MSDVTLRIRATVPIDSEETLGGLLAKLQQFVESGAPPESELAISRAADGTGMSVELGWSADSLTPSKQTKRPSNRRKVTDPEMLARRRASLRTAREARAAKRRAAGEGYE